MHIETQNNSSITIPADLSGDSLADFDENLKSLLQKNPEAIYLDSSNLVNVTSSDIKVLWAAYQLCQDTGVELRLKSPSPGLIRVLQVLDLYSLFTVDPDSDIPQFGQVVQSDPGECTEMHCDAFHADPGSINAAIEEFLKFLKHLHTPEMIEYELRTVFYEVATNIRIHAEPEKDGLIVFTAMVNGQNIVIVFVDSAKPFDVTSSIPDVDLRTALKSGQKCGFGVTLIRKLTDKISYIRMNDAINVLILEKKWSQ